jgi:hypothetical protein
VHAPPPPFFPPVPEAVRRARLRHPALAAGSPAAAGFATVTVTVTVTVAVTVGQRRPARAARPGQHRPVRRPLVTTTTTDREPRTRERLAPLRRLVVVVVPPQAAPSVCPPASPTSTAHLNRQLQLQQPLTLRHPPPPPGACTRRRLPTPPAARRTRACPEPPLIEPLIGPLIGPLRGTRACPEPPPTARPRSAPSGSAAQLAAPLTALLTALPTALPTALFCRCVHLDLCPWTYPPPTAVGEGRSKRGDPETDADLLRCVGISLAPSLSQSLAWPC